MMGYTDDVRNWWRIRENAVNLSVHHGSYPVIDTMGRLIIMHQKWRYDISIGDRFRFNFDFETRKCSAFYNDEFLGELTQLSSHPLADKIYLTASVSHQCSFET